MTACVSWVLSRARRPLSEVEILDRVRAMSRDEVMAARAAEARDDA